MTQSDVFQSADALRVTQSDVFQSADALRVTQSDVFQSAKALRVTQSDVFRSGKRRFGPGSVYLSERASRRSQGFPKGFPQPVTGNDPK